MSRKIQWGIIGLGKIAHKFAHDLMLSNDAELYGVASREKEKAEKFSRQYNAKRNFGSYLELVQDQEIDVVYIATPHPFHFENIMLCLDHNKGVLCEKPMGMNSIQTKAAAAKAQSKGLFLMEGLWTRFIPATEKLIELLESKVIGDILFIRADFGFKADLNPDGRMYNKSLGGGSLLDVGIYPIYLSLLALGVPSKIQAMARWTASGVDSYCSMMFDYSNNAKASLESTVEADTPIEAHIYGENGSIKLHSRFHHSEKITVKVHGEAEEVIDLKYAGNGYVHEIQEVNRSILNGQIESEKHSHARSIELSELLDRVKNSIGLSY